LRRLPTRPSYFALDWEGKTRAATLAFGEDEGVHDERITAVNFETWLAQR
jgi:hypothetical protein